LRKLHAFYVDSVTSPFAVVHAKLDTPQFHANVIKLIQSFDAQLPPTIGSAARPAKTVD
jgi:hypothetical protein